MRLFLMDYKLVILNQIHSEVYKLKVIVAVLLQQHTDLV